jgi:hypothetical protein
VQRLKGFVHPISEDTKLIDDLLCYSTTHGAYVYKKHTRNIKRARPATTREKERKIKGVSFERLAWKIFHLSPSFHSSSSHSSAQRPKRLKALEI